MRRPQEKVQVACKAESWSLFLTQENHREAFQERDKVLLDVLLNSKSCEVVDVWSTTV